MMYRLEKDGMGEIEVATDRLWGAQTERARANFAIGNELMPEEMIVALTIVKKACAVVNCRNGYLAEEKYQLIVKVCDEILQGQHRDMFPLHVWMTGSGTQFNMNVNEVIANRCSQLSGQPLASKNPVHPNDDVNMAQSSNDNFPTAMHIAAVVATHDKLLPAARELRDALAEKVALWQDVVKIGRTHLQDATPLTLGQEFSGYVAMLDAGVMRIEQALLSVYELTLGGTAVGTGINAWLGFAEQTAAAIADICQLPFVSAENKFAAQGAHDALVQLSAALKGLAVSLYKIANDIRLLACGPRAGIAELILPANEPGSSIMPGKVNPTQCEALTMVAIQVMANDVAVTLAGAGGMLEMNVYKPVMIYNLLQSINLLTDAMYSFTNHAIKGLRANEKRIAYLLQQSLMLVTALSPVIGYDKASEIAHLAAEEDLTLKEAALRLGYVSDADYERIVRPETMVRPQMTNK